MYVVIGTVPITSTDATPRAVCDLQPAFPKYVCYAAPKRKLRKLPLPFGPDKRSIEILAETVAIGALCHVIGKFFKLLHSAFSVALERLKARHGREAHPIDRFPARAALKM